MGDTVVTEICQRGVSTSHFRREPLTLTETSQCLRELFGLFYYPKHMLQGDVTIKQIKNICLTLRRLRQCHCTFTICLNMQNKLADKIT